MLYRKVYLEWAIGEDSLLYNVPVGFEIEFSKNKHFHEITTTLTTFNEVDPSGAYRFSYSLDNGESWISYPWGDQGQIFTTPFLMRLEITPSDLGYSLSFNNGTLKKISADSKAIIDSAIFDFEEIIDADQYEDILYLVGTKTLYKIDGRTLEPYDNSLPLLTDNALGVCIDESRETLWQINKNSIWLRSLYGDILWEYPIPNIDVDYSSSSSSSISSSSSSSSSSSESSESIGNTSSSSSSSSSSSESSMGLPDLCGHDFDAFPESRGMYFAVSFDGTYYTYHNLNGCILQHDPYGIVRWKLYLNEQNRLWTRDHYYKDSETLDPKGTYTIHMWWDTSHIPVSGTTGSITDY